MKLTVVAVMAMAAANVNALFRLRCEDSVALMRSDPIVAPGTIAAHLHTFHGPNTVSSKADYNALQQGDCSSCALKTDNSAYWTPTLYYKKDGKLEPVGQKGGMLAYYFFRNDTRLSTSQGWGHENIDAFPKDFKMLAGDPFRRSEPGPDATEQEKLLYKAIGFNCLGKPQYEDTTAYHKWRKDDWHTCPDGIRAELWFPSCWDGRLDSPNHRDHVAYPDEIKVGKCPKSHPRRLPTLLFETVWSTDKFRNQQGGEFVWSHGDPTGLGYHGDFQNGWVEGVLEKAMQEPSCYNDAFNGDRGGQLEDCKAFSPADIRTKQEQLDCKAESEWNEDVGATAGFGQGFRAASAKVTSLDALPGCNEITYGPERAVPGPTCDVDGKPIDGSAKPKPSGGALLDDGTRNKGVKLETPVVEVPKEGPKEVVEEKEEPSIVEDKPAVIAPVEEESTTTATTSTSSNKYLVIVTTTQTRTVTEGEPIPTEWLEQRRRRHVHGKHRRHHNH